MFYTYVLLYVICLREQSSLFIEIFIYIRKSVIYILRSIESIETIYTLLKKKSLPQNMQHIR
jgi:hypothetical protein